MTRDAVLVAHVALGTLGLLLGPAFLITRGGVRAAVGRAYQVAVAGVASSAAVLAVTAPALWWLLPVAAGTEALALLGLRAWRRRRAGWPRACAHLLGGSYVALVTGVLIARTGNPVFWLLPTVVAQWPIVVAQRRLARGVARADRRRPGPTSSPVRAVDRGGSRSGTRRSGRGCGSDQPVAAGGPARRGARRGSGAAR